MKAFEIVQASRLQMADLASDGPQRWLLQGRAHEDLKVGETLMLGSTRVTIEAIRTYGKDVDSISRMMTGELVVRLAHETSPLFLTR